MAKRGERLSVSGELGGRRAEEVIAIVSFKVAHFTKGKADYGRVNFFMSQLSSLSDAAGHEKKRKKKRVITVNLCLNSLLIGAEWK